MGVTSEPELKLETADGRTGRPTTGGNERCGEPLGLNAGARKKGHHDNAMVTQEEPDNSSPLVLAMAMLKESSDFAH